MPEQPVALITGASRGIGKGIALALARLGYSLVINYRSKADAAHETAAECRSAAQQAGHSIQALPCAGDVSSAADRQRLLDFTRETYGRLDLLVNNAGVAPETRVDLLDATEASFDRLININLKGPFFLTQQAARWMIEQSSQRPAGAPRLKIITISSISAYTASITRGDYCISKAGLSMLTSLFASRLAEHGIQVFEIRPGIIETDMTAGVREKYDALIAGGLTPIRRWGSPDDIGRAVAALAQDALPFSTGEVLNIDGGFHLRTL